VRDDDFDESAPPPPHERSWRHPAELAAQERDDIARFHPTPRLSRRASVVTAAASIVVSAAVLSVVLPGGPNAVAPAVDGGGPRTPTTTVAKGSFPDRPAPAPAAGLIGSLDGSQGEASIMSLGGEWFLAGIDDVGRVEDAVSVRSAAEVPTDAVVLHRHEAAGIVLLCAVSAGALSAPALEGITGLRLVPSSRFTDRRWLASLSIVDHRGTQSFVVLDSRVTEHAVGDVPVVTDRPVRGVAALVDAEGRIVGAAVHCSNGTWLLSMERIIAVSRQWGAERGTDPTGRP
jgi:hypothetical protein